MFEVKWFYGVVENVQDATKSGMAQVRVYGAHDHRKEILPTKFLPWAQIMVPPTSSSTDGVGCSPTGLQIGSEVMGISLDSTYTDLRILFTWHSDSKVENEKDVNKLARGVDHPLTTAIKEQLLKDIQLGTNNKVNEEPSERAPEYPMNDVHETRAGFIRESDSTAQKAREASLHPTGMYEEWRTDGSKNRKVKSFFEICLGRAISVVNGSWFMKVGANLVQKVGENFYRGVTGQNTVSGAKSLQKFTDGMELVTPEVRISKDVRVGGVLYIPEIRVGSLKADSISCSSTINAVCKGAEQAGIASSLSSVTLAPGSGAGDTSTTLVYEDNGGDYPL